MEVRFIKGIFNLIVSNSVFRLLTFLVLALTIPILRDLVANVLNYEQNNEAPFPIRIILLGILVIVFIVKDKTFSFTLIGLSAPKNWFKFILQCSVALLLLVFTPSLINNLVGLFYEVQSPNYQFFEHVYNNLPALIYWLFLSWLVGGFFEELIFRGFLQNEISKFFRKKMIANISGIIIQGIVFGLFHIYQGFGGVLVTAFMGISLGILYQLTQNLWPLIIGHGVLDSLAFIVIYLNGVDAL